jgi:hypothetical protein
VSALITCWSTMPSTGARSQRVGRERQGVADTRGGSTLAHTPSVVHIQEGRLTTARPHSRTAARRRAMQNDGPPPRA